MSRKTQPIWSTRRKAIRQFCASADKIHTLRAIESELAWLETLGREKVIKTPGYCLGRNGRAIQFGNTDEMNNARLMVLFHFVDGDAPDESVDMVHGFQELEASAARCHDHAISWVNPTHFERLTWDADAVFGPAATWGNWRDAPLVDRDIAEVLEEVEETVCARLAAFGKAPERFNLIHADMRLANLLVGQEGTRLIDFDDCGHGWFLYDFAASISLIEKRSVYRDIQSRVGPGVSVGSGLKCRGRGRD